MTNGKKRGPKTDNPKDHKITVKIDKESTDIINDYCKQESISMAECVRRGVKRLKPDLNKK